MTRRNRSAAAGLAALLMAWSLSVQAEEVRSLDGDRPELSLEGKMKKSLSVARIAAIGTFSLPGAQPELRRESNGAAFLHLRFRADRVLNNFVLLKGSVLELNVPVFLPKKASTPASRADVDAARKTLWELERKLEAKSLLRDAYEKAMAEPVDVIARASDYMRSHVLVPVRMGSHDSWYRLARVPVILEKEQYLVIIVAPDVWMAPAISSGEIDIYPAPNEEEDARAVAVE